MVIGLKIISRRYATRFPGRFSEVKSPDSIKEDRELYVAF